MTQQEPLLPLLVVEDDAAIRELLEEELQDAGYTTLGVPSAEEAIALLSHTTVSLVITDVRLPGITRVFSFCSSYAKQATNPALL